jgi:hypothetical protein
VTAAPNGQVVAAVQRRSCRAGALIVAGSSGRKCSFTTRNLRCFRPLQN